MDYIESTLKGYLDDLSARKHVPGGGSAAALVASTAAALNLMVINYTIKPDRANDADKKFEDYRDKQETLRSDLMILVDEDCRAFSSLMDTLSGGDNPEEKYITSANVPMEICRKVRDSLEITELMLEGANMNLVTDIGCAVQMFKAAFNSAKLNVEINLKYIKDSSYVSRSGEELASIASGIEKTSCSVLDKI